MLLLSLTSTTLSIWENPYGANADTQAQLCKIGMYHLLLI
uniref:Uncharacterized protein n=1 Tax=Arundo donax TaxID=35708 RepID=A0A0A9QAS0_ARUDO